MATDDRAVYICIITYTLHMYISWYMLIEFFRILRQSCVDETDADSKMDLWLKYLSFTSEVIYGNIHVDIDVRWYFVCYKRSHRCRIYATFEDNGKKILIKCIYNYRVCSRRSQTPNTKLLEGFYSSQIRQHMRRHKHMGPKQWHHNENEDEHEDHVEHGDAKRDQTWRH